MKQNIYLQNIQSQQPLESSSNLNNFINNTKTQLSKQDSEINPPQFQNLKNTKFLSKPIGIYNFNSNKTDISSLEESIDEVVSLFIEHNKENIINYVVNEVENKLNEKIKPLNTEINNIKNNFNSLYTQEFKEFKELDILNDCHNNIININNKVNIMNENINKYNDEIKGFNICDNRLKFLNKLNNDLQEFINGINNDNEKGMDIDIDEENHKIDIEQKKQDNLSQELDTVFNETIALLKGIQNINQNNIKYKGQINNWDALNNLKNTINDFEIKFNYEKPIMENQKQNNNNNVNKINYDKCFNNKYNDKMNIFEGIPDFFDF